MPDGTIPSWLVNKTFATDNGVTQGVQTGFNMGIQLREQERAARAMALREEAMRLSLEEKERVAQGAVAVTRILAKMGKAGGYSDPQLQAEFWDEVSRNPHFANSPAFNHILDSIQASEQAKERATLLRQRYSLMGDIESQRQEGRLDLQLQRDEASMDRLRQSLENSLTLLDEKSEDARELRQFQNELDIKRDSLKPRTLRPERYDLDRSDEINLQKDNDELKAWRKVNRGKKFDAEYDRRSAAIEQKYESRKKKPGAGVPDPVAPSQSAPAPAPEAKSEPVPPPAERKVGTVYQTPKGPYRWNGSGWEAP